MKVNREKRSENEHEWSKKVKIWTQMVIKNTRTDENRQEESRDEQK